MILAKTAAGQQALKDRSLALSLRQRAALILVDGKRTVDSILQATEAAAEDIAHLRSLQLVQLAGLTPPATDASQRFAVAHPIATRLAAELGPQGARLGQALKAATRYEELAALAPHLLEAVGVERFRPLHRALNPAR